jgi:ribosomal protein L9
MNIILLDHIDKVGDKHDVVKVKDGFGRNYLIPRAGYRSQQSQYGPAGRHEKTNCQERMKELGAYEATIKFHPEVMAPVKFEVVTGEEKEEGADDAE